MKKWLVLALCLVPVFAAAAEPRHFRVEVREITGEGERMVLSERVMVERNRLTRIKTRETTTYPSDPPVDGGSLESKVEILWLQPATRPRPR